MPAIRLGSYEPAHDERADYGLGRVGERSGRQFGETTRDANAYRGRLKLEAAHGVRSEDRCCRHDRPRRHAAGRVAHAAHGRTGVKDDRQRAGDGPQDHHG
jgi:hypothetical protein